MKGDIYYEKDKYKQIQDKSTAEIKAEIAKVLDAAMELSTQRPK